MKKLSIILIMLISLLIGNILEAQNVGINADASIPDASSGLDIKFNNKGLLIPRVSLISTTSTSPITTPIATSLLVYNTATVGDVTPGYYYWTGSKWMRLLAIDDMHAWLLTGNSGTTPGTNFIGTTDAQPLVIKTNNIERVRITTKGQIETKNTGNSVFIGEGAGANDDLSYNGNIFIGYQSGYSNTTGYSNTANGYQALYSNTTGFHNTANGTYALYSNTTGSYNIANGSFALYSNTTGNENTANGSFALRSNTTGHENTATGYWALYSNTTGSYNVTNGYYALASNTTGNYNTATGFYALMNNGTGYHNTANGSYALSSNTTGNYNTATGDSALYSNTTGNENTAIGEAALGSNTEGIRNTANGYQALYSNTTGIRNTANGYQALYSNTTGNENTANGYMALHSNTTGYQNTANGFWALRSNTTGNENTAIGYMALYTNTIGNNNTAIGSYAFFHGTDYFNSTAIGYNTRITASNQIRLGDSAVTSIGGHVGWTTLSDMRFKKDVKENVPGLDFIMKLKPVTYYLVMDTIAQFNNTPDSLRMKDAEALKGKMLQTGFIAQDVEKAASECGFEFSGVDAPKNEKDYYGLRYATFVVPLVKAVQEQQTTIDKQQATINNQQLMINELKNENENIKKELQELRQLVIENQKTNK